MPDAASIPPDVPTAYKGAKALGDVGLTIYNGDGGGGLSSFDAYAGATSAVSPVAEVYGSYNVQQDKTPSDYHAQINWGDGPSWDTNTTLALELRRLTIIQVNGNC